MSGKNAYIVAGPNGAGKTTFARKFLPKYAQCPHFVNADLIAQGLSPFSPRIAAMKAGRLVLEQIEGRVKQGEDFGFETTLAGKSYVQLFRRLKAAGGFLEVVRQREPKPLADCSRREPAAHHCGRRRLPDDSKERGVKKKAQVLQDKALLALKRAVRKVIAHHKQTGRPLAIWRDGKVVWVKA